MAVGSRHIDGGTAVVLVACVCNSCRDQPPSTPSKPSAPSSHGRGRRARGQQRRRGAGGRRCRRRPGCWQPHGRWHGRWWQQWRRWQQPFCGAGAWAGGGLRLARPGLRGARDLGSSRCAGGNAGRGRGGHRLQAALSSTPCAAAHGAARAQLRRSAIAAQQPIAACCSATSRRGRGPCKQTRAGGGSCPPRWQPQRPRGDAQDMATPRPPAPRDAAGRPGSSPAAQSIRSLTQLLEVRGGAGGGAEGRCRAPTSIPGGARASPAAAAAARLPTAPSRSRVCRMTGTRHWAQSCLAGRAHGTAAWRRPLQGHPRCSRRHEALRRTCRACWPRRTLRRRCCASSCSSLQPTSSSTSRCAGAALVAPVWIGKPC